MTEDEFWDRLFASEGLHFHELTQVGTYRLVRGGAKGAKPNCTRRLECYRMTWAQILGRALKEARKA